jgi:hypothetical protein
MFDVRCMMCSASEGRDRQYILLLKSYILHSSLFDLRRVDAESISQILQVFLFLGDDFAKHFT